jgi:hypothetical protein
MNSIGIIGFTDYWIDLPDKRSVFLRDDYRHFWVCHVKTALKTLVSQGKCPLIYIQVGKAKTTKKNFL